MMIVIASNYREHECILKQGLLHFVIKCKQKLRNL